MVLKLRAHKEPCHADCRTCQGTGLGSYGHPLESRCHYCSGRGWRIAHGEDEFCPECCEHGDVEDFACLDCGQDMTDHFVAAAEALAEGER